MATALEQKVADLEAVVKKILDDAIEIGGLPALATLVNLNDEIALAIKATGQTVKTSISQLISGGVGISVVKHPVNISFTFPLNNKTALDSLHGTLLVNNSEDGIALNNSTPIVGEGGQSRVFAKVIAGTDLVGTMTITGTSVDRNTGVETEDDTEDIAINGLTVDTSSDDSNGNPVYGFENAYISAKWWRGTLTFSTTDLDISNIVFAQIGYEQFADSPNIQLTSFDTTYITANTNAVMDMYLYSVEVVGSTAKITKVAQHNQATGRNIGHYRHKRTLTASLDGTTDGVFIDLFLKPDNLQYFSSFVTKVWAEITENINVVIDGSLGLDNIVYGESLQVGDLVYLKNDGKYYKADNTSESTSTTELRLIIEAGVTDDEKLSLAKGQFVGTGFTAGNEYVGTNGTITSSRPTDASEVVRIVSTSINATTRYFDASKTWIAGDASKINGVALPGISNDVIDAIHTILNAADQTKKFNFDLSLLDSAANIVGKIQNSNGTFAWLTDIHTGGGTATSILTDFSSFNNNLSDSDINVQLALQTLNDLRRERYISGYWVDTFGNTDVGAIEVGNEFRGWPSATRYVVGIVIGLPFDVDDDTKTSLAIDNIL